MLSYDASSFVAPILRRTPIFHEFSERDISTLSELFTPCTLEAGQYLFRQGDMGNFMALLAEGSLGIKISHDPALPYDATVSPPELIGEMTCIDPAPRSASVSALVRSTVLIMDRGSIHFLREHHHSVFATFLRAVSKRVGARLRVTNEAISTRNTPTGAYQAVTRAIVPREVRGKVDLNVSQDMHIFTARELEILVSVAHKQSYPQGAFLCREGEPGKSCYIIVQGDVDVYRERGGMRYEVGTLGAGQLLGQLALIDHSVRSASAQARTSVIVAEFTRDDFNRLLSASTPLALHFQELVTISGIRQLRQANQHYDKGI